MEWEIPKSVDVETLVERLVRHFGLAAGTVARSELTYLDSFDRRLWRGGLTLELERRGRRGCWRLAPRPWATATPDAPPGADEPPALVRAARPIDSSILCRAARRDSSPVSRRGAGSSRREPSWWRLASDADEDWVRRLVSARGWLLQELPPGELRAALAPLLSMRAALPWLEVRSTEQRLEARGAPGGERWSITVARRRLRDGGSRRMWAADLTVERRGAGDGARDIERREVGPDRERAGLDASELERWLERAGLEHARLERLPRWLERLGRSPEPLRSRRGKIAPTERADAAVRLVLRGLCQEIIANLPGTVAQLDSEFLHDLRVAVRRSRSALGRMREVLPERSRARFRRELRWLGQLSGPARDLDVYLLELDARCAALDEAARAGIAPLRRAAEARRAAHQSRLARALCSKRAARLLADWEAFLDRTPPRRPLARRARAPIAAVAAREIRRAWRNAIGQGRRVGESSPASELHELRKSCKKLRYLLELFGGLVDGEATRTLVTSLKGVQRVLGDVQDLEVESALLADLEATVERTARQRAAARAALQGLREGLAARKQRARSGFTETFAALAAPEQCALVRASFGVRRAPARTQGDGQRPTGRIPSDAD